MELEKVLMAVFTFGFMESSPAKQLSSFLPVKYVTSYCHVAHHSVQPQGAFLVRISTRIWGYTLSFVDKDRFKVGLGTRSSVLSDRSLQHFLIDSGDKQYSVFGAATTRSHQNLTSLIRFHGRFLSVSLC